MRILAPLRIALRALRRNKLRTVLTMLGIIIGVGAVIAMVGIGNGAKAQVEAQIASLGQNVDRWATLFAGTRPSRRPGQNALGPTIATSAGTIVSDATAATTNASTTATPVL